MSFGVCPGIQEKSSVYWTRNDGEAIAQAKTRAEEMGSQEEPARALLKTFMSWLPQFQSQNVPATQPLQSKRHIYSCYCTHAVTKGIAPVSWPVFLAVLNESQVALLKKLSTEQAAMTPSTISLSQDKITSDALQSQALNLSSGANKHQLLNPESAVHFKCGNMKPGNEKKERKDRRINKILRMQGKEYFGERRTKNGNELVLRGKKVMGKPCDSNKCKMSRNTRFCHLFTEEDRERLFNDFWKMTWDRRKEYVTNMTTVSTPRRHKKGSQTVGRKQLETQFFLSKNNECHQVCKFSFLSTLGVKDSALRGWARSKVETENPNKPIVIKPKESKIELDKKYIKNFLILLSTEPKNQQFKSKRQIYGYYKSHAESEDTPPLSWPTFLGVYNEAQLPLLIHTTKTKSRSTQTTEGEK